MEKYRVTAYKLSSMLDKNLKFARRWVKIAHWDFNQKRNALKCVNIWSHFKQPFFKVTINSLKKEDK